MHRHPSLAAGAGATLISSESCALVAEGQLFVNSVKPVASAPRRSLWATANSFEWDGEYFANALGSARLAGVLNPGEPMKSALRALLLAGCLAADPAMASDDRLPEAVFDTPVRAGRGQPYQSETAWSAEAAMPLPVRPAVRGSETAALGMVTDAGPAAAPTSRSMETWQWRVVKTEWTDADEKGFEVFVHRIGESECGSMHECLTSPQSNPAFPCRWISG